MKVKVKVCDVCRKNKGSGIVRRGDDKGWMRICEDCGKKLGRKIKK